MRFYGAPILAVVAAMAGCAKPGAQLIGRWNLDPAPFSGRPDVVAAFGPDLVHMTIGFRNANTFAAGGMQGGYEVSGHAVTLTPTKINGMDFSKYPKLVKLNHTVQLTLSDDEKTLALPGGPSKRTKQH